MKKILINHGQLIDLLRNGRTENVKYVTYDFVNGEEYENGYSEDIDVVEVK